MLLMLLLLLFALHLLSCCSRPQGFHRLLIPLHVLHLWPLHWSLLPLPLLLLLNLLLAKPHVLVGLLLLLMLLA
jgi:hypothetical protein